MPCLAAGFFMRHAIRVGQLLLKVLPPRLLHNATITALVIPAIYAHEREFNADINITSPCHRLKLACLAAQPVCLLVYQSATCHAGCRYWRYCYCFKRALCGAIGWFLHWVALLPMVFLMFFRLLLHALLYAFNIIAHFFMRHAMPRHFAIIDIILPLLRRHDAVITPISFSPSFFTPSSISVFINTAIFTIITSLSPTLFRYFHAMLISVASTHAIIIFSPAASLRHAMPPFMPLTAAPAPRLITTPLCQHFTMPSCFHYAPAPRRCSERCHAIFRDMPCFAEPPSTPSLMPVIITSMPYDILSLLLFHHTLSRDVTFTRIRHYHCSYAATIMPPLCHFSPWCRRATIIFIFPITPIVCRRLFEPCRASLSLLFADAWAAWVPRDGCSCCFDILFEPVCFFCRYFAGWAAAERLYAIARLLAYWFFWRRHALFWAIISLFSWNIPLPSPFTLPIIIFHAARYFINYFATPPLSLTLIPHFPLLLSSILRSSSSTLHFSGIIIFINNCFHHYCHYHYLLSVSWQYSLFHVTIQIIFIIFRFSSPVSIVPVTVHARQSMLFRQPAVITLIFTIFPSSFSPTPLFDHYSLRPARHQAPLFFHTPIITLFTGRRQVCLHYRHYHWLHFSSRPPPPSPLSRTVIFFACFMFSCRHYSCWDIGDCFRCSLFSLFFITLFGSSLLVCYCHHFISLMPHYYCLNIFFIGRATILRHYLRIFIIAAIITPSLPHLSPHIGHHILPRHANNARPSLMPLLPNITPHQVVVAIPT